MTAWWIGVIAFLVVGVPVLAVVLQRLLRQALELRRVTDELALQAEELAAGLDGLEAIERTPALVDDVAVGIERYGRALEGLR